MAQTISVNCSNDATFNRGVRAHSALHLVGNRDKPLSIMHNSSTRCSPTQCDGDDWRDHNHSEGDSDIDILYNLREFRDRNTFGIGNVTTRGIVHQDAYGIKYRATRTTASRWRNSPAIPTTTARFCSTSMGDGNWSRRIAHSTHENETGSFAWDSQNAPYFDTAMNGDYDGDGKTRQTAVYMGNLWTWFHRLDTNVSETRYWEEANDLLLHH